MNMKERTDVMKKKRDTFRKNGLITMGILGTASLVAFLLQQFVSTDTHVPLLFVLSCLYPDSPMAMPAESPLLFWL